MPELPEVETIRLFLQDKLDGKNIVDIKILNPKSFHGNPKQIIDAKVVAVKRKGKILTFQLSNLQTSTMYLSFHLKLSGQLLLAPRENHSFPVKIPLTKSSKLPAKTTRVILYFDNGSILYFNDLRKFGWMKLGKNPESPKGTDIISSEFTFEYFEKSLMGTKRPIKTVIMDQDKMAGVGNIYANDSLWEAKIHPETRTNLLNKVQKKDLYNSILKTIKTGLKFQGSSAKDELY